MFLKCDCKLGPGLKWEVIIYLKKTFVSSPVFKCLGLLGKIKLCSLWGHLKICHNSLVASVWHRHVAAMFQTQARTTTWPVRCLRKWFRVSAGTCTFYSMCFCPKRVRLERCWGTLQKKCQHHTEERKEGENELRNEPNPDVNSQQYCSTAQSTSPQGPDSSRHTRKHRRIFKTETSPDPTDMTQGRHIKTEQDHREYLGGF